MNQHILETLASLHTRLTLLEMRLSGISNGEIEHSQASLELISHTIEERNTDLRALNIPHQHYITVGPVEKSKNKYDTALYGKTDYFVRVQVIASMRNIYNAIAIKASHKGDPFQYRIVYSPVSSHDTRDEKFKARGIYNMIFHTETIQCRHEDDVIETLVSMLYPP
jgi:hypothetical protein